MNLQPVSSQMLTRVGHDGTTLIAEFKSGRQYEYANVPAEEFDRLMAADSVGKHFNLEFRLRPNRELEEHERIS